MRSIAPGLIWLLVLVGSVQAQQTRGLNVAVIAPSVSTSMEARRIRDKLGWHAVSLKEASAILVVVRSDLSFPLNNNYDSVKDLKDAAERQLNISGDDFHLYVYDINDDLSVRALQHKSYRAND